MDAPRQAQVAARDLDATLLAWFHAHGRELPWRQTRDPYAILVSEVMLQQTQVERVVPRWLRWLRRWPTAEALAAASPADAIREWQGLGYNRRAVNLHRAAAVVAERGWPDDLTQLPGVGPYTAAAVRAFAFGDPVLPVDTNVRRVQERTRHAFEPACAQALMDLGATICLARVPRCERCPLATACPSRGRRYKPLRRQSRFEGSFRQRRARMLRLVSERERALSDLDEDAVAALREDGLVEVANGFVTLPDGHPAMVVTTRGGRVSGRHPRKQLPANRRLGRTMAVIFRLSARDECPDRTCCFCERTLEGDAVELFVFWPGDEDPTPWFAHAACVSGRSAIRRPGPSGAHGTETGS